MICNIAWAGYSITISKASNKLALYDDGKQIRVFPVATGRHHSFTPEGTFTIVSKIVNPYYGRGKIPGGSPNNPLGPRWLGLSIGGGGTYGIHGNSNPASIGTYASGGCIRMYDQDVIWLFNHVPTGTPVTINSSPISNPLRGIIAEKPKPKPIKLVVRNKLLSLPHNQGPEERGSHILIPLRPAVENLGYELVWHNKYNIVEIKKEGISSFIDVEGDSTMVDGRFHRLPTLPSLKNNGLYVPLEFFNLLAGITTRWNEQERKITLVYK